MHLTPDKHSTMRRSKTTYYPASHQSFGLFEDKNYNSCALPASPRHKKKPLSQANASWGNPSSTQGVSMPQQTRNMFLQNDEEISSLLSLLKSNDFSGHIVPEHHSRYMQEPGMDKALPHYPKSKLQMAYRSDGHLLKLKSKSNSNGQHARVPSRGA
jgi:hypothetical protein